ncbi:MAG: Stk1 family PASTA domain-containing Ser/Thr kinase [Oscillospiraceae bacterium]|nr:Stk1 family PASTA domain-containing Ser/Thr kinase [Oscillospiraceae bacterium]
MDKYIGRLLDNRYEILEVIGTGGMAVVYKARCHRLNRLVAIKILKDDFLEDEEFRRRFHSESQAVAMLSHPNIISVYDVSTSITADYIVMELIDGITLKQYMEKKGVLNWKETLHFAIQIAKALEHAHSRGIVHRDIKPHNVMVLKNGSVKVTDFGIARMMSKGNTLTKEALGSVHYISPEQAKGGRVDNRSDIYSLGVVMYEMMSGRPPYDGESPVSVAIQHINGGAVLPSTLNPNIPGGLEQIIMRAMAHEPSGRYATATQMLADLDEFRKDPAILFDYNTPPTDEVTNMPKPAAIPETPAVPTTAERKAQAGNGEPPVRTPRQKPATPPDNRRRQTPPPRRNREDVDEEEAKRNKITTIAIISCAAVMVVAIVIFLIVLLGSSTEVQVDNLVGRVYANLNKDSYEYTIKIDQEVYDDKYEAGLIIFQTPAAGDPVVKNGTVWVTVSLGPKVEPVYMPDVSGKTKEEAKNELSALPIQITYKEPVMEHHDTVEAGKVIRTEPAVGTELSTKQEITLYISLGVEIKTSEMPSVVGQQWEIAEKILDSQNLDLVYEVIPTHSDDVAKDIVISTEPAEKAELKTGQTVKVYVSDGPKLFTMPNVMNLSYGDAFIVLQGLGHNVEKLERQEAHHDTAQIGQVIEQSVEEKQEISVNATIILTVSKGPAQTKTVTRVFPLTEDYTTVVIENTATGEKITKTAEPGAVEIPVELTGTGTQTYSYYYMTDAGLTSEIVTGYEVNFDE